MAMSVDKKPGKRRTIPAKEFKDRYRQGESQAGNGPSKSSQKDRPDPRGISQRVSASLRRRREQFVSISQGGHKHHFPGSQNRKKGCSL